MKKLLSLVLALSMVLGMFSFAFAAELSDIEGEYYEAAVEALVELGVVKGYTDNTYRADQVVTRAELATMLVKCLGQEEAAEIAKGSTQFSDVAGNHWGAGYINVAAQYKVVVGNPDGTFRPEDPVSYAEAVTMVLRALGYKNVVESAGTWPTNYITKANELQLLKDMEDVNAEAGATRGNVAVLLWNMLRTQMWDIKEENQTNGMTYGKTPEEMLEIKFPDYVYEDDYTFAGWYYSEEEAKVYVGVFTGDEVLPEDAEEDDEVQPTVMEYEGNDFYELVPGSEVAALYRKDKKANVLLSVVPTAENVLVEGPVDELAEKYTDYEPSEEATYAHLLLSANKKSATVNGVTEFFGGYSEYVTKVEEKSTYTKVTTVCGDEEYSESIYNDDEDVYLVIDGDERLSYADLKVGDVITWIADNVVVVCRESADGEFESLTYEETATDNRYFIELDGEEYEALPGVLTAAKVNEDDEEEFDNVLVGDLMPKKNDYLGEDAALYFNFLGEVVRIEFGVVDASDIKGEFFMVPTGNTWQVADENGAVTYIKLANEDGVASYVFEEDYAGHPFDEDDAGCFFWVEFNDDEEIEDATLLDGEAIASAEDFDFDTMGVAMDEDTKYVGDYKVTASTKVFTARQLEDEDGELMNKYELVVTEGPKALEGLEEAAIEAGVLALEADSIRVAYAFVEGEATSADKEIGIVDKFFVKAGVEYVVVDGETYELSKSSPINLTSQEDDNLLHAGSIVAYVLDSEDRIKITFEYETSELPGAGRVTDVDDSLVTVEGLEDPIDLDLVPDQYEGYRAFKAEVGYDKDGVAFFESVAELELNNLGVKKNDGLAETDPMKTSFEAMIIVRGVEWAE